MTERTTRIRGLQATATTIALATLVAPFCGCSGASDVDDVDERPASVAQTRPGFVSMTADVARAAGIEYGVANAGTIFDTVDLQGTIATDPQRVRRIQARYPGVVKEVRVRLGDRLPGGAFLATVESDESLQAYAIRSPIAGVVTELTAAPGDHTGDAPMMTITDLSHVWVDVPLFAADARDVRTGMPVVIRQEADGSTVESAISYISPIGLPGSRTTSARVVLDNTDGRWIPGMGVTVTIRRRTMQVPVLVRRGAIQHYEGKPVVFVQADGGFRLQPVVVGIDDGENVEIRSGLARGATIAVSNSYVVLAELEKGSVTDDD